MPVELLIPLALGATVVAALALALRPGRGRLLRRHVASLEGRLERARTLTGELACELGLDGRIARPSEALSAHLGLPTVALAGLSLSELVHPDDLERATSKLSPLDGSDAVRTFTARTLRGDGSWERLEWRAIVAPQEGTVHVVLRPVAPERRAEPGAEGDRESRSGLANRPALREILQRQLAHSRRYLRTGALVVLSVETDDNDKFAEAAETMWDRLRASDALGRLGGFELAAVLLEVDGRSALTVAEKLIADLPAPASAGVALLAPEGASTPEELFTQAELALGEAREAGGGRAVLFDGDVRHRRKHARLRTPAERLRGALARDTFALTCRPAMDVGGYVDHHELHVAVRDENGTLATAAELADVAERCGLAVAVDGWLIHRAISLVRARFAAGDPVTVLAPISGSTLRDPAGLLGVVSELGAAPDAARDLVLGLSEADVLADPAQARRFIARHAEFGCRFALLDFGGAPLALAAVKDLPVDLVRLDARLVRALPDGEGVLRAVVAEVRQPGRRVVADGVDDEATVRRVLSLGIELHQGACAGAEAPAADVLGPPAGARSSG